MDSEDEASKSGPSTSEHEEQRPSSNKSSNQKPETSATKCAADDKAEASHGNEEEKHEDQTHRRNSNAAGSGSEPANEEDNAGPDKEEHDGSETQSADVTAHDAQTHDDKEEMQTERPHSAQKEKTEAMRPVSGQSKEDEQQRPTSGQNEDMHAQRPASQQNEDRHEHEHEHGQSPVSGGQNQTSVLRSESREDAVSVTGPDTEEGEDFLGQSPDRDDWGQTSDKAEQKQEDTSITDNQEEADDTKHRIHMPDRHDEPQPSPPPANDLGSSDKPPQPMEDENVASAEPTAQQEETENSTSVAAQPDNQATGFGQKLTKEIEQASHFQPSSSNSNQAGANPNLSQPDNNASTSREISAKPEPTTSSFDQHSAKPVGPAPPAPVRRDEAYSTRHNAMPPAPKQQLAPPREQGRANGNTSAAKASSSAKQKKQGTLKLSDKKKFKFVLVGDGEVGKTAMLQVYMTGKFPKKYTRTVEFGDYKMQIDVEGQPATLELWDTAGNEEYDGLRPLAYADSDMVLICYSVVDYNSFENVTKRWMPEKHDQIADAPILLIGTKTDLRTNPETLQKLAQVKKRPVTVDQGVQLAQYIRAVEYVECSSLTQDGLEHVFDIATTTILEPPKKKSSTCGLL